MSLPKRFCADAHQVRRNGGSAMRTFAISAFGDRIGSQAALTGSATRSHAPAAGAGPAKRGETKEKNPAGLPL